MADAKPKVDDVNAAPAPGTVDEAEAAALFKEFSAKHADPYRASANAEDFSTPADGDEGKATPADPKADTKAKADTDPAKDTPKSDAAKSGASKDATTAADDIWAKAAKDPRTAALKQAYDAAPAEARPAIEATQRRLLEQGQEIHRLRTQRSTAAAPAPAAAAKTDEPTYDPAKDSDWQATLKEYPDALKAVESMVGKKIADIEKRYAAKIDELSAKASVAASVADRVTANDQLELLAELAPRYAEVREMPGFKEVFQPWLEDQTAEMRAMVLNNNEGVKDARQVATVFKLFQADTQFGVKAAPEPAASTAKPQPDPAATKRRQQLQGSTTVESKGSSGLAANPSEDDEEAWYAHWSNQKKKAVAEERRFH